MESTITLYGEVNETLCTENFTFIPKYGGAIMNRVKLILAASLLLAFAFTLSCGGGDDSGGSDPGVSSSDVESEDSSSSSEEIDSGQSSSSEEIGSEQSSSSEETGSEQSSSSTTVSSSSTAASSTSSAEAECKDSQGRQLYCEWAAAGTDPGGCYAIDARYADPAGQTCAALVANCNKDGAGLYTGVTGLNEDNNYGKGIKCASNGGTKVSGSSSSSSSSSGSSSSRSSSSLGGNLCAGFVDGTTRLHEGKYKAQFCDERDGKKYVYVRMPLLNSTYKQQFGEPIWMAENLNYDVEGSRCYKDDPAMCDKYGRLYDWAGAGSPPSHLPLTPSDFQGICPSGWYLPSLYDWESLPGEICGLTAKSGWLVTSNGYTCGNSTDYYGFSALPGGEYSDSYGYSSEGSEGNWWMLSDDSKSKRYFIQYFKNDYQQGGGVMSSYHTHFSIRCFKIISSSLSSSSSAGSISSSSSESCIGFVDGTTRLHEGKNKAQFCDERDGKKYVYVTIGSGTKAQTWMAENLNYAATGSKCGDDNSKLVDANTSRCDKYGRFYDWATAMDGVPSSEAIPSGVQGVCPSGWHLPSHAEWKMLVDYVDPGGEDRYRDGDEKLKATNGWNSTLNDGEDVYGFAAIPGGNGSIGRDGVTTSVNYTGFAQWWSATDLYSTAWCIEIQDFITTSCSNTKTNPTVLSNVRCIKD